MQKLYKTAIFVCVTLGSMCTAQMALAQAAAAPKSDSSGAVRAASKAFQAAARQGDEKALRKMWTANGEYVDAAGKSVKADELIRRLTASPVANAVPATEAAAETTLRFVTPDVAIEDGIADRVCAVDGSLLTRRYTATWVKRDGNWLLDNLRESVADASPINDRLKPLEWLLGEWAAKADDTSILVSAHWSDGGNFIVRDFVVGHDGGESVTATQRIGWDPISAQIKSWTFDSQGGVGEDHWRRDGKRWLVETADVTPDGKEGKTSSVYVPGDERHYTWEVVGADVAGTKLKPVRIEFRRATENE